MTSGAVAIISVFQMDRRWKQGKEKSGDDLKKILMHFIYFWLCEVLVVAYGPFSGVCDLQSTGAQ